MSLFDSIKGSLGGVLGSTAAAALPGIIERVYPGGLQGVLNQLSQSGYGKQVNSWLGRGENQPITTDDLRNALNDPHTREIADKLGIPYDQVLDVLAKVLPQAVDQHSPDGQLQPPAPESGHAT
ncbi:YidB family protein [Methylobacterium gnaphalii]|uniref:DUF937 domain-containing protein n=1 Tax=Methylobacterium gnaphalii TaxID=1010610 RepID=A0A512JKI2_9HYPH|nr:YidB family protein [Methylobacterium gnaphalii]GEP10461.1 hypothetical protein MGN01_23060 [Methylobacterium gnaphalii]GJD70406.1 hypothetical protein MMMDOFMJ_3353 [Methylobacterium gnaphalii]GLS47798.1 hypothetical protein GCM10007885_06420 [Methylobacterium gnaphalii]